MSFTNGIAGVLESSAPEGLKPIFDAMWSQALGKASNGSTMEATSTEIEHEFFGYIEDVSELERLAKKKTIIKQPELRSANYDAPGAGLIRVRSYDDKKFVLTIKVFAKNNGVNSAEETEYDVDKSVFDSFMKIAPFAVEKVRYTIEDPTNKNLCWEVDIPLIPGIEFTGCKIDLEVPSINTPIPAFPFKTTNMLDKEDKEGIGKLMNLFNVVNHNNISPLKVDK